MSSCPIPSLSKCGDALHAPANLAVTATTAVCKELYGCGDLLPARLRMHMSSYCLGCLNVLWLRRLHGAGGHAPARAGRGAELSRAALVASEAGNAVLCLPSVFMWVQPFCLHAVYALSRAFFNLPLFLIMPTPWTTFQKFVVCWEKWHRNPAGGP